MENTDSNKEQDFFLAQWMDGKISDDDLRSKVSEADYLTYKKLQEGIKVFETLEQTNGETFDAIQNKIQKSNRSDNGRSRKRRWMLPVAASVLILMGMYFFFGNNTTRYATSFAEQKTITLPDHSQVVLNARSSLQFDGDDWTDRREVFLEGEAFFSVEKGSKFRVKTANGSVEVLGTVFNVNATLDYFEVNCYEGKVEVITYGDSSVLTQAMSVRKIDGNAVEQDVPSDSSPSWLHGESSFKSVPLIYVIDALERQYDLKFNTNKIDVQNIFTGSFGHENRDVALATVFKTMRIHYQMDENNVIVLSPYE